MRITEVQINYAEPAFPGGLSINEMQTILKEINWLDGQAVARQTQRCNNRCNGNDVDVEVPLMKVKLT